MSAGTPLTHVPFPISAPFGSAELIEHEHVRAVDVGTPNAPPVPVGYLDGIQRYAVEGRFGLVPVLRGYVAAAVLQREGDFLQAAAVGREEFLVASLDRLTDSERDALRTIGLPLYTCAGAERAHPLLDVQAAARVVEERREQMESDVARRYQDRMRGAWLVLDGSVQGIDASPSAASTRLGVIKSHETQYLAGTDLEVALALQVGQRSSVFSRSVRQHGVAHTWYLRLWPWEEHDLLHGLVRLERAVETGSDEATAVSRWILSDRAPLAAPDRRWDRLIYPIHQVEVFLRAQSGGWW